MLDEPRLWKRWLAAAHAWRPCWSALAPALLTPPSEGPNKTPKTANLRHRNGAVSFLDVFPRTLWGRMAFSSNPSCSTGTRKGREAPAKGEEQAAAPGEQAPPHRLPSRLEAPPCEAESQVYGLISPGAWKHETWVLWRQRFPVRCLQVSFKPIALCHNEAGSEPMQSGEYNFLFLSQGPRQSSSFRLPFKPHAAIIWYPKSRWSAKDISAGQETWSRNPQKGILQKKVPIIVLFIWSI